MATIPEGYKEATLAILLEQAAIAKLSREMYNSSSTHQFSYSISDNRGYPPIELYNPTFSMTTQYELSDADNFLTFTSSGDPRETKFTKEAGGSFCLTADKKGTPLCIKDIREKTTTVPTVVREKFGDKIFSKKSYKNPSLKTIYTVTFTSGSESITIQKDHDDVTKTIPGIFYKINDIESSGSAGSRRGGNRRKTKKQKTKGKRTRRFLPKYINECSPNRKSFSF
jgi:hypothetical protein